MLYSFNPGFFQNFLYTVDVVEKDAAPHIVKAGPGDVDFYLGDHSSRSGSHDQHPVSHEHSFFNQMGDQDECIRMLGAVVPDAQCLLSQFLFRKIPVRDWPLKT